MMKVKLQLTDKQIKVEYFLDDALLIPLTNILSKLETDGDITYIQIHYIDSNNWAIMPVRNTGYKPTRPKISTVT